MPMGDLVVTYICCSCFLYMHSSGFAYY